MPRVSGTTDKNHLLVSLGEAVRARRKALNLSQEALADHAGIDRSHMGKIERGERNVTMLNVAKLAVALSCRPSDLLLDAGL
ncbi:helix-turn-helix domain-containing protein [Massilia sp. BKSP1R2A-1]|uniref:helix-turn-helix domain-containing protein n=1 Tax=Massilia sp. BKSP1R2A-1 TaxID=3422595 RepID=UPI003D333916